MNLRDTVIRRRALQTATGYGNTRRDWANATIQPYPAEVQPFPGASSSSEDVVDQNRTTTRWRIFLGPDADLAATDRIEWDGLTYEVDGDVERWKRRGRLHHLEAILIKITQG